MRKFRKLWISLAVCLCLTANVSLFSACQFPMVNSESGVSGIDSEDSKEDIESEVESEDSDGDGEDTGSDGEDTESDGEDPKLAAHPHVWEEDGTCATCARKIIERDGEYILFGEYPQTIKADDVEVKQTASANGYYAGDDGAYYAKVTATPSALEYTFTTGESIAGGESYYFKVEPLRWRILEETDGEALLLCDSVIAAMAYQTSYYYDDDLEQYYTTANGAPNGTFANNYKYSNVRKWLVEDFYNNAFDEVQQQLIEVMQVQNGAETTSSNQNRYTCEDTEDKVTLPSFADMINVDYGFRANPYKEDSARVFVTTDYARAVGAWMSTSGRLTGNGYWWLRSPYAEESSHVGQCERSGKSSISVKMDLADCGVVPMILLAL